MNISHCHKSVLYSTYIQNFKNVVLTIYSLVEHNLIFFCSRVHKENAGFCKDMNSQKKIGLKYQMKKFIVYVNF